MRLLLSLLALALSSMALWLTMVIALTCLGGLASPGPVPRFTKLKELIEELDNITQNQKAPLCNGSMVWSVNLTAGGYCAALESLINVSSCSAIQRTQRMLGGLCTQKDSAGQVPSSHIRDTKIEVAQFIKDLLRQLKKHFRDANFKA
ncbi:interleukin-13 [Nycticebus coucang]|uniref:interleukin-13 n=1 Tax=Nycticebus coucang TaxID=9470 RepID=UPI00234C42F5|nr:interleukin-13 [Nycticebus coucang]